MNLFDDEKDDIFENSDEFNIAEVPDLYDDEDDDEDEYDETDVEQDGADEKEKLTCPICGKEINFFTKKKVVKGLYICGDCEDKSAVERYTKEMKKLSADDALEVVIEKIKRAEAFTITKSADGYLLIDDTRQLWTVPYAATKIKNIPKIDPELIFPYSAIKSYELIEDGNLLAKGGRDMPLIGGLLFGGEGAGLSANSEDRGTVEHLQVRINLQDISVPRVFVNLIFKEMEKEKKAYGQAFLTGQKVLSILELICHQDDEQKEKDVQKDVKNNQGAQVWSAADEIKKYKELLDIGAITEEEYETKKAKLLNL